MFPGDPLDAHDHAGPRSLGLSPDQRWMRGRSSPKGRSVPRPAGSRRQVHGSGPDTCEKHAPPGTPFFTRAIQKKAFSPRKATAKSRKRLKSLKDLAFSLSALACGSVFPATSSRECLLPLWRICVPRCKFCEFPGTQESITQSEHSNALSLPLRHGGSC